MNNKQIELLIPVDQFYSVLGLCDQHSVEKREVFKAADALRIKDGEEYFSLPEYTSYVFNQLDISWKCLTDSKSTSDFANAESKAREYLCEWTSILTCLLNTAVGIDTKRKDDFDIGFKLAVVDFQHIFYRLRSVFEYAYDLAYAGLVSRNDNNADAPESLKRSTK